MRQPKVFVGGSLAVPVVWHLTSYSVLHVTAIAPGLHSC